MKAALLSKPDKQAMDDEELVGILQDLEVDAADYVHGSLADARELAIREYYQRPYADEVDDGLSKFVTSEVQDTIEWVLPSLLRMFTAGEDAVKFEPRKQEDEQGAEQATEACNYVFYTQNPGFLVLHTAFKDALMLRNGAIEVYYDTREVTRKERFKGVSEEELAFTLQQLEQEGAKVELVGADPVGMDEMGFARFNVEVKITKEEGKICIEAFPPDELLIDRDWRTPLLDDCPYICRIKDVSLSYLRSQGWDVDQDDLTDEDDHSSDRQTREEMSGVELDQRQRRNDEAMLTGRLRREWVLVDYDGDGIAERRYIVRINKRILVNELAENVPIVCGVPIMRQHRWDGLSLADTMADLQKLKTEITRQLLNSLYFSVTPRNQVLTDESGVPRANVDDLLNFTPGGYQRVKVLGAVAPIIQPFVGADAFPMLQYVDAMKDNRSGINAYFQGNDANALNKTATGINQLTSAAQQRVELMARMLAETMVKPLFKIVFKMLLDYQMEPLSFKLRNSFVELNPQEWKDGYDMTISVGLGTGNKDQMLNHLMRIQQMQVLIAQAGPLGAGQNGPIVQPKHVYEVAKKTALNSGFKSPDAFFADPGEMVPPQPAPPPPEIQKEQMRLQHDAQKTQATMQADQQKSQAEQDFEARRILQEQQHEKEMAVLQARLDAERAQFQDHLAGQQAERQEGSSVRMLQHKTALDREAKAMDAQPSATDQMLAQVAQLAAEAAKPKKIKLLRDAQGRVTGAEAEPPEAQPGTPA